MSLSGLERQVLELADVGDVLVEPESVPTVNAVYRRLDDEGLVDARWWDDVALPSQVTLTPAGRTLLRSRSAS